MLVIIAGCKDVTEGEAVKSLLAENGIECHLQKEPGAQVGGEFQAVEINVLVEDEDAEKARALLSSRRIGVEPVGHGKPGTKSISQILLHVLSLTVFVVVLRLVFGWLSDDFDTPLEYVFFAGIFFAVIFPFEWFYNRKSRG